jgi:hypothetical protein
MSTNLLGLLVVLRYGQQFSFQARIVPGFFVYAVCMITLPFVENKGAACSLHRCGGVQSNRCAFLAVHRRFSVYCGVTRRL